MHGVIRGSVVSGSVFCPSPYQKADNYVNRLYFVETRSFIICSTFRASDRSRKKKSNFAGFLGTNSRKKQRISREFRGSFQGKLHQKAISKKQPILCSFSHRQPKRTSCGFGLQRSFGRNILELLVYYLMPNKCKKS